MHSQRRRGIDAALKIAFSSPLVFWTVLWMSEIGSGAYLAEEAPGVLAVVAIISYCFWSVGSVWRGRRPPEHTAIWAVAAAIMWIVAVPAHMDLRRKARAKEAVRHAEIKR